MTIRNITVVGAGVMGRGIAYVSALAGFQTNLIDISENQLEDAMEQTKRTAEKGVERGKLTAKKADALITNLRTSTDLAAGAREIELLREADRVTWGLKQVMTEEAWR